MPTELTKNFLPICILSVMRTHADQGAEVGSEGDRYLTQSQIRAYVEEDFGLKADARSIARNMRNLAEAGELYPDLGITLESLEQTRRAGANVVTDEPLVVHAGWRLVQDSGFETSEVRMLIDTVLASPVIPQRQMKALTKRLLALSRDEIVVPKADREGHSPAVNSQFFLNLEVLNEAIQQRKRVSFVLGAFGQDKKLRQRTSEGEVRKYTVHPVQLLVSKGHYYFLANFGGSGKVYKFRVELMLDVRITDEDAALTDGLADLNVLKFREQHAYMMSGEVMSVTLRVSKDSLHTVFDQFGPNLHFLNEQDGTVDVKLSAAFYSVLFWALQHYRSVEVVEPPELRSELERAGRVITQMYEGGAGALSLEARQS